MVQPIVDKAARRVVIIVKHSDGSYELKAVVEKGESFSTKRFLVLSLGTGDVAEWIIAEQTFSVEVVAPAGPGMPEEMIIKLLERFPE